WNLYQPAKQPPACNFCKLHCVGQGPHGKQNSPIKVWMKRGKEGAADRGEGRDERTGPERLATVASGDRGRPWPVGKRRQSSHPFSPILVIMPDMSLKRRERGLAERKAVGLPALQFCWGSQGCFPGPPLDF
ncbi:hypothetical protein H1C71_040068, partial [Ictidomys tridecemlineatus]